MIKNLSVNSSVSAKIDKKLIHSLVNALKKELRFEISSLEINFIDGEAIAEINKKYLKHDYSTDIITFNYSNKRLTLDSEIYISFDDAERNSNIYRVSLGNEIVRLVIHGLLHLIGYDDTDESSNKLMRREENRLVNKYQLFSNNILTADNDS